MLETEYDQYQLNHQCLTFLEMSGPVAAPDVHGIGRAQMYSLDTQSVYWPDLATGEPGPPVSLRQNRHVAQWEPMTQDKFVAMALEVGVLGRNNKSVDRIVEPDIETVTISPDGFIFRWPASDEQTVKISDVRKLALHRSDPRPDDRPPRPGDPSPWSEYSIENGRFNGPGFDRPAVRAMVGSGIPPKPPWSPDIDIEIKSLGDMSNAMADALNRSDNRDDGEYTPEAAAYVLDNYGINVANIDWDEAAKARQKTSLARIASFDLFTACEAIRHAFTHNRRQQKSPARIAPARTPARKPARTETRRVIRQPGRSQ